MLPDLQPTLHNDLVILRPLERTDFAALYQVARDPLIWVQHPCKDRYKEDVFKIFFEDAISSKGALIVLDKKTDQVIGSTRFKRIKDTDSAIEIGWSFLSRAYWGGAYNRAVKLLLFEYAFKTIDDIIFYIDTNNIRSQKAIEKLGGKQISGSAFALLLCDNKKNLTYRINKADFFVGMSGAIF